MVDSWLIHELWLGLLFWLAVHGLLQQRYRRSARCQAKRQAAKKSSKATQPFPDLTQKPHCEACAQASLAPIEPVRPAPPVMTPAASRPRAVRTLNHYCPERSCPYYGWLGRGNIRANGHPNSQRWRQWHCLACGRYCLETHGTLFHGKTRAAQEILRAIAALAEGLGLRVVARVFEVEPNTVLSWLIEAADHAEALSRYLLHDLNIEQVQLDELFALVSDVNDERRGQVFLAIRSRLKAISVKKPGLYN